MVGDEKIGQVAGSAKGREAEGRVQKMTGKGKETVEDAAPTDGD